MRRITPRAAPILLVSVLAPLYSQQDTTWQDPSPHAVQFVTVENDVRLEVLDWGGAGRPIVLLAGGGVEFCGIPGIQTGSPDWFTSMPDIRTHSTAARGQGRTSFKK